MWNRQDYVDLNKHPDFYFVTIDDGDIQVTKISDTTVIARGVEEVTALLKRVPNSRVAVSSTVHFASEHTDNLEVIAYARSL